MGGFPPRLPSCLPVHIPRRQLLEPGCAGQLWHVSTCLALPARHLPRAAASRQSAGLCLLGSPPSLLKPSDMTWDPPGFSGTIGLFHASLLPSPAREPLGAAVAALAGVSSAAVPLLQPAQASSVVFEETLVAGKEGRVPGSDSLVGGLLVGSLEIPLVARAKG